MAVLVGSLTASYIGFLLSPSVSSDLNIYAQHSYLEEASNVSALVGGTATQVIAAGLGDTKLGSTVLSYKDDYYYRFHLIPSFVDVGILLTDQVRQFSIWNAFLTSQNYASLTSANDDGIILTDPATPPSNYAPLEIRDYVLGVSIDGPPQINASYTFILAGQAFVVSVIGSRLIVFPFMPNWGSGIAETLQHKSVVLTSISHTEQRYTLTQKARRGFEFSCLMLNEFESSLFESLLWGWQGRQFALPVHSDISFLSAAQTVNDLTLFIDPNKKSFVDDGLAIIYQDVETYETVKIQTVNANDIMLAGGLLNNWAAGTRVFPVNIARLGKDVAWVRHTNDKTEAALRFMCDPTITDPHLPALGVPVSYNGYELYLERPNWVRPVAHYSEGDFVINDKGYGAVDVTEVSGFQPVRRRFSWLLTDRDAIYQFRGFLGRRVGRLKPCYLPTWNSDISVAQTISSGDTTITVRDNLFARLIGQDSARSHIYIRTHAGQSFARAISNPISNGDGTLNIDISSGLGVTLSASDILMVSYLGLYRFRNDTLKLLWVTTDKAVVESDFVLVKS